MNARPAALAGLGGLFPSPSAEGGMEEFDAFSPQPRFELADLAGQLFDLRDRGLQPLPQPADLSPRRVQLGVLAGDDLAQPGVAARRPALSPARSHPSTTHTPLSHWQHKSH
jgi:hypothetical protein